MKDIVIKVHTFHIKDIDSGSKGIYVKTVRPLEEVVQYIKDTEDDYVTDAALGLMNY